MKLGEANGEICFGDGDGALHLLHGSCAAGIDFGLDARCFRSSDGSLGSEDGGLGGGDFFGDIEKDGRGPDGNRWHPVQPVL